MYSTITAHTRSFQAFFCTRATSFLPLTTGRNVGLTATMQQRPSALYHILSNPVNSTPTWRFSFLRAFSPVNPKTGTPLGVPVFRILLSILRPAVSYHRISRSDIILAAMMTIQQASGAARSVLPSPCDASLGHALISSLAARGQLYQLNAERGAEAPPDGAACPLEPPPEQRQEQPEWKQIIPRLLIRQLLPLYRQHHRPAQTRRRFPRPSPPVHGISR